MSSTPVIVNGKSKITAAVIWLHGLGDSGFGWSFLANELSPFLPHVKWIFPHAPAIPVTLNGRQKMPAWFDLRGLDKASLKDEDEAGLRSSFSLVDKIVSDEVEHGIPADRIIIGGFSQGGALALYSGLTVKHKLAGIVGCSSWLPLSEKIDLTASDAINKVTPIAIFHGEEDPVVKPEYGKESANKLEKDGYNVTFKSYPNLGHSVNEKGIRDILEFLVKTVPNNN